MSVMTNRKKFSSQPKAEAEAEAVELVLVTGEPIAKVSRDLGISEGTLGNWVRSHRRDNPDPDKALSPTGQARLREVETENARLKMENEFLKKAAVDSTRLRNSACSLSAGVSKSRVFLSRELRRLRRHQGLLALPRLCGQVLCCFLTLVSVVELLHLEGDGGNLAEA